MRLRPATEADARLATSLVIKVDLDQLGVVDYSEGDLRDEWRELDLARDTRFVEDDEGTPIAYAHFRGEDFMACVDPAREGEGAGTALLEWGHARARERKVGKLRQAVGFRGHAARALLEAHGYTKARSYWRMVRETTPDETADETGLRAPTAADAPTLYAIHEAAFGATPDYVPKTEEHWTRREFGGHDVDLAFSRYAESRGFALVRHWEEGLYVPLLAVHPDHQGRGLGARLLRSVFARADGRRVELNVASDNPNAVKLYERVGMRQGWRVDDYQKALPD